MAGEEVHFNIYGKDTRAEGRKVGVSSETLLLRRDSKEICGRSGIGFGKVIKTSGGNEGVKAQTFGRLFMKMEKK